MQTRHSFALTGRVRLPTFDQRQHAPMRILSDRPQLFRFFLVLGKDHLATSVLFGDSLGELLSFFHGLRVALEFEKDRVLVRQGQGQALKSHRVVSPDVSCYQIELGPTP